VGDHCFQQYRAAGASTDVASQDEFGPRLCPPCTRSARADATTVLPGRSPVTCGTTWHRALPARSRPKRVVTANASFVDPARPGPTPPPRPRS